jgi:acetylornithine/succinyldiaminopimelate/putrescine aminotransferase
MPLGAFIADRMLMNHFTDNPVLGHITTFGGHPVCCAAGLAAFQALLKENMLYGVLKKSDLFRQQLVHSRIKAVCAAGLWLAVAFESFEVCKRVIDRCIAHGLVTDWFLFAPHCLRISPPLTISENEIHQACAIILQSIEEAMQEA